MPSRDEKSAGIQVIARAATILRRLADHPEGLSLGAIAGEVGLARSTVQRIVQALEAEGFVEPSGPRGGFSLGPALAELVFRRQIDILSEARPFLESLCAELGETVALCGMNGGSVQTIDRCIAEQPLRVVFPFGTIPFPAHRLAPGRAILGELPPDRAARILALSLAQEEIGPELARLARDRDAARDSGVFIADLAGFAVPLRTRFGLHAIAAILPVSRVADRGPAVLSALRSCRDGIEGAVRGCADAG